MSRIALNKLNYKRFAEKCRGARVEQLNVQKLSRRGQIVLKYNAGGARGAKLMNGEWVINGSDEAAEKAIDEALAIFRKDFLLSLGSGLENRPSLEASGAEAEAAEAPKEEAAAEPAKEAKSVGKKSKKAAEPDEAASEASAKSAGSEKAPKTAKKAGKGK